MQEWNRTQDPRRIGTALHERFTRYHADVSLLTPEQSARSLVALLRTAATGRTWTISDHTPEEE
jgi:hypothetical protein